jgi:sec-independent protein translocase protein TatB
MLDVGFSEILLTSAIALIVLGPERLPKVARQVGNWMGRARAMARQLTEQLEREVNAEELLKLQTKSEKSSSASNSTSSTASDSAGSLPSYAVPPDAGAESVSAVDTSYMPTTPLKDAAAPAPPAAGGPAEYSPAAAAAPHGADWHISPPASKTGND